MHRACLVAALLLAPALLAGCAFPTPEDPYEARLEPDFRGIPGLTPPPRSHPVALHLSADGRSAYVALAGTIARPDDRIAVIDLETGTLDHHITVGPRPLAFAADPKAPHRVLVAHPYAAAISILDTERGILAGTLDAPYYLEDLAWHPSGDRLIAADRDRDRLIVYNVSRADDRLALDEAATHPTGPNPEHVVFVPPPADASWPDGRLVAVTDRHGASVTIIDLDAGTSRRLDTGGPPLALTARDGLVFVAGYGPGNGTGDRIDENRTVDLGTAAIENSLLVLDLRAGPELLTANTTVPAHRYRSDTAHPESGHARLSILGGAGPSALYFDDAPDPSTGNATATLWIAYHATDQVQALHYRAPGPGELSAEVLATTSGSIGDRLSHETPEAPLRPGRLSDSTHGIHETGPGPRDLARYDRYLLVVDEFPETLHIIDLADCPGPQAATSPCSDREIPLVRDPRPYPEGPFEEGERLFYSALPSADQDRSCAACHVGGLATGGTWSLPHRGGVPVRIPRLDQVADNAPWLLDGRVAFPADYLDAAGGDLLLADPTDPNNLATRTTREPQPADDPRFPGLRDRLTPLGTNATTAADYMRLTFAYAMGEERLLPVPPGPKEAPAGAGAKLFVNPRADCVTCHQDPGRATVLTGPLADRVPKPPGTDTIKAPALGGLWDRTGTAHLWDGRATNLHAALLPADSPCLPAGSAGLERDWHGVLAERTCASVDDLVTYLLAYEARR